MDFNINGGVDRGKLSFYCKALEVSRQAFYSYLINKDKPWKYELIAEFMVEILGESVRQTMVYCLQ